MPDPDDRPATASAGDPPEGPIDPALAAAYRAALYVVDAPGGPVVLRVDVASDALGALEAELAARGVPMLPAEGRDPDGAWPPEAGVLAFGLSRDAADALARRYRQNAYVWIARPAAPCRLAFTRPLGDDRSPGRARGPARRH